MQRSRGVLPAAILIALGLLLLGGNLLSFDFWNILWPLVPMVFGLMFLVRGPVWLGMVGIVAGAIFLADALGAGVGMGSLWPLIIIAIGVGILLERSNVGGRRSATAPGDATVLTDDMNTIDLTATFSNTSRSIMAQAFQGGTLAATFGEITVDLRQSQLHENGADLQVSATFGGVTLNVPREWVVHQHGSAVLADIEDKRSSHPTEGRALRLRTSTTLGRVTVED